MSCLREPGKARIRVLLMFKLGSEAPPMMQWLLCTVTTAAQNSWAGQMRARPRPQGLWPRPPCSARLCPAHFWVQLSGAFSVIQVKQRQAPSLPCKGLAVPSHRPRPRAAKSSSSFLFPTSGKASLFTVMAINSPKGHILASSGNQWDTAPVEAECSWASRNLPARLIFPSLFLSLLLPTLSPCPSTNTHHPSHVPGTVVKY